MDFPPEVQDFANVFVEAQRKRNRADYDPFAQFRRSEVQNDVDRIEEAMRQLRQAPLPDRKALAAWVLLAKRRE